MMDAFHGHFGQGFASRAGAAVLELGSVPLPVVTARIDRFIAKMAKALIRIWSE
jgi:hypothetical protein